MYKNMVERKVGKMINEGDFNSSKDDLQQLLEQGVRIILKSIIKVLTDEISIYKGSDPGSKDLSTILPASYRKDDKLALTIREAAKLLGLSRGSMYEAVRQGQIPSIRIGKRIIVPRAALIKILSPAVN